MSILGHRERVSSRSIPSRRSQGGESGKEHGSLPTSSHGIDSLRDHRSQSRSSPGVELGSNPSLTSVANRPRISIKNRHTIISASGGFFLTYFILGSKLLAIPFTLLGAALPYLIKRRRQERAQAQLGTLWPELLDHMISGLRSGLSIAETLVGLARRGPEISRPIFKECHNQLLSGADIEQIFRYIKEQFNDPVADQVCEVLDFARGTGSRDTAITLRTLGDFIRSDIAVRGEIHAKLGWVKNSAVVAAVAPWILLVILSAQPSTVQAFSTSTGILILLFGVAMSGVAYFWMSRVGRVQSVPRIFLLKDRP